MTKIRSRAVNNIRFIDDNNPDRPYYYTLQGMIDFVTKCLKQKLPSNLQEALHHGFRVGKWWIQYDFEEI